MPMRVASDTGPGCCSLSRTSRISRIADLHLVSSRAGEYCRRSDHSARLLMVTSRTIGSIMLSRNIRLVILSLLGKYLSDMMGNIRWAAGEKSSHVSILL